MFDASGDAGGTLRGEDSRVTDGGDGLLYYFGLGLGRTVRFLKNGPVWLAKGAGRSIVKIGALAHKAKPRAGELQEHPTGASAPPKQTDDEAVAAMSARDGHPNGDAVDALDMGPDLRELDVLVGKKKTDK